MNEQLELPSPPHQDALPPAIEAARRMVGTPIYDHTVEGVAITDLPEVTPETNPDEKMDRARYEQAFRFSFKHEFPGQEPSPQEVLRGVEMMKARDEAFNQMYAQLRFRIEHLPVPDAQDRQLGIYKEAIEPQARDAILVMNAKGYPTNSSGFGGDTQGVDGSFIVPPEAIEPLKALGATVKVWVGDYRTGGWIDLPVPEGAEVLWQRIEFTPRTASLRDMKQQWDAIAQALPEHPKTWMTTANPGIQKFSDMLESGTLRSDFLPWWLTTTGAITEKTAVPKLARAVQQDPQLWAKAQEALDAIIAQIRAAKSP